MPNRPWPWRSCSPKKLLGLKVFFFYIIMLKFLCILTDRPRMNNHVDNLPSAVYLGVTSWLCVTRKASSKGVTIWWSLACCVRFYDPVIARQWKSYLADRAGEILRNSSGRGLPTRLFSGDTQVSSTLLLLLVYRLQWRAPTLSVTIGEVYTCSLPLERS